MFDILYRLSNGLSLRFLKIGKLSYLFENLRTLILRNAGANIKINAIVRSNVFIANPQNLHLGKSSKIGEFSKIYNFDNVFISDYVEIGNGFLAYTNKHIISGPGPLSKQGSKMAPVIIESDCYIGANVTVLGGVTIESRCVVGACSLVISNLKSGYLYAGVPAKRIKKING